MLQGCVYTPSGNVVGIGEITERYPNCGLGLRVSGDRIKND
ncbi:hypothetical protein [Tolypothrix sp. FACHB-123]|nr:hypothetical protein [Tolypothrix sp. FACHB-123]